MGEDDIVQQVRAAREAFASQHDFDVEKMVAFLKAKTKAEGRVTVSLPPRPALYVAVAPIPPVAATPPAADVGV
jgi:hypothetical protein